jgi:ABC-type multidrug transport system ATPase subunit
MEPRSRRRSWLNGLARRLLLTSLFLDSLKFVALPLSSEFSIASRLILTQGYGTVIGDAGIKLSGGQRQRIAIARSIVKQPRILILDEATSAIDINSERIVQAALDRVSKNRTTITIAHRLSTIRKANNIVVLKKGRVVQQRTHEQLMADTEGAYWGLANAQQLTLGDDSNYTTNIADPEKQTTYMEVEKFREQSEPGRVPRNRQTYRSPGASHSSSGNRDVSGGGTA